MTRTIKLTLLSSLLFILGGCASAKLEHRTSSSITVAPAIDIPYQEVVKNIPESIGAKVRWGGQVISSEDTAEGTRLTVLAFPLNAQGLPEQRYVEGFEGGRFIVNANNFDSESNSRFVTVFAEVSDKLVLRNGKYTKEIPVVTAIELQQWNDNDQRYAKNRRYRLPYNGLVYGRGYSRFSYNSYGRYNYGLYGGLSSLSFNYPYRYSKSRRFRRNRY